MSVTRRRFIGSMSVLAGRLALGSDAASASALAPGMRSVRSLPLPLQPFTVDLLDLNRGNWQFQDALGQELRLDGPVEALACSGKAHGPVAVAYLCCDPEFPRDPAHAILKNSTPAEAGGARPGFRIDEPFFSAAIAVHDPGAGVVRCSLSNISLGPATSGDHYVEAIYVLVGEQPFLLWISGNAPAQGLQMRILTNRVGGVFHENERVRLTLMAACAQSTMMATCALQASDYATGKVVWDTMESLTIHPGELTIRTMTIPLRRFGVFQVVASINGKALSHCRVCRIPTRRPVSPDMSAIGINVFQQQIWWYAFQVPLVAAAGVRWVRPWLAWENTWAFQESRAGTWDFRPLDATLRRLRKFGLRYQDILFRAPDWVAKSATDGVPPLGRMADWAAYVQQLATRLRGRLRHYEVWNEPDGMWPRETDAAEHYFSMLKATFEAAKEADPQCVILGLSHAGDMEWLKQVCQAGAGNYMDVATIHIYAPPATFVHEAQKRQRVLKQYGIDRTWINEFGATAYDFNPAYSKRFECSEQSQASALVANYAQALSLDSQMKAFWFCTYDPRDPAHETGWTGDAGIGIMYLGFLPKLAYAALACFAHNIDGRKCLGRLDAPGDLHQVSFGSLVNAQDKAPIAVAWHDGPGQPPTSPATILGCLPQEVIQVRDMFSNPVASGTAGRLTLDFSHGPLYIQGSEQMAGAASVEQGVDVEPATLSLGDAHAGRITLALPTSGKVQRLDITSLPAAEISTQVLVGLPVGKPIAQKSILVTVVPGPDRVSGAVVIRAVVQPSGMVTGAPVTVVRIVPVDAGGGPNLVRDGGFLRGDLSEWVAERTGAFSWDPDTGHTLPGSLRMDAPFTRRLVMWDVMPTPGRPIRFRAWVKTASLTGCRVTLNLALFTASKWLQTWRLATNGQSGEFEAGWRTVQHPGSIPNGTAGWTLMDAKVDALQIPAETSRAAFLVDTEGGGSGSVWFDDLDLWQPAPGRED